MKQERVWLAEILDLALDLGIVVPTDLLAHLTTTQLAQALPHDELARLLAAGLSEATFAPETVVHTIGVMTLVEHLSTDDVWAAIRDGMERSLGLGADDTDLTRVQPSPAAPPPAKQVPAKPAPPPEKPAAAPEKPASPAEPPPPPSAPVAPPPTAAAAPVPKPAPPRAAPPKVRATLRGQLASAQIVQTTPRRPDSTEQSVVVPPVDANADLDDVLTSLEEDDK